MRMNISAGLYQQNCKSFYIAVNQMQVGAHCQDTQLIGRVTEILFNIKSTAQRRKQITSEFSD